MTRNIILVILATAFGVYMAFDWMKCWRRKKVVISGDGPRDEIIKKKERPVSFAFSMTLYAAATFALIGWGIFTLAKTTQ